LSGSTVRKLAASAAILASVGAFVSFGVFSSFSRTQTNSSSLTAGSLTLTRDTPASLIDSLTGLIPGDIVTRCVKVTKGGDIASTVTLAPDVTSSVAAGSLADALQASVESGSALTAVDGTCTGFVSSGFLLGTDDVTSFLGGTTLAELEGQSLSYSATDWANNTAKYYRVRTALPTSIGNTLQGAAGTFDLTWTATQPTGNASR
jgi:hypothetical protein